MGNQMLDCFGKRIWKVSRILKCLIGTAVLQSLEGSCSGMGQLSSTKTWGNCRWWILCKEEFIKRWVTGVIMRKTMKQPWKKHDKTHGKTPLQQFRNLFVLGNLGCWNYAPGSHLWLGSYRVLRSRDRPPHRSLRNVKDNSCGKL